MAQTALIVVDLQNGFFVGDGPLEARRPALVAAVNRLVAFARREAWPVVWVRTAFAPDLSDAFGIMRRMNIVANIRGTPAVELLAELERRPEDPELVKKRYSAFFGTDLMTRLEAWGVGRVVVAGINTHACVRMTAIDAYQHDLEVVVARDGVASYDEHHHQVTLDYLEDRIAWVLSCREIVQSR